MPCRGVVVSLVALVLAAGASACGGGDDEAGEVEGLPTIPDAPEVVVVGTDFAFEPEVLHLEAGVPVNVVFESAQGGHNLVVPEAGFQLPIVDEGESTSGAITIDGPGTYELLCSVPGHADEGMVGTVEVTG